MKFHQLLLSVCTSPTQTEIRWRCHFSKSAGLRGKAPDHPPPCWRCDQFDTAHGLWRVVPTRCSSGGRDQILRTKPKLHARESDARMQEIAEWNWGTEQLARRMLSIEKFSKQWSRQANLWIKYLWQFGKWGLQKRPQRKPIATPILPKNLMERFCVISQPLNERPIFLQISMRNKIGPAGDKVQWTNHWSNSPPNFPLQSLDGESHIRWLVSYPPS